MKRALFLAALWSLLLTGEPLLFAMPPRLGQDVVPTFEAVRLRLDPDRMDYGGSVRVTVQVRRQVASFRLHAEGMKVVQLALSDKKGAVAVEHAREGALLAVRAAKGTLLPGEYTLSIDFSNSFGKRAVGLYRMVQEGHAYAFTQFESADARKAFPCWDEPGFKIPYQMTLEVPQALLGVTNTPLLQESGAAGWKILEFQKTRPLPSYLLAIAVGPLVTSPLPGLGVPGRVIAPQGQGHLVGLATELTPPILRALEKYFGRPYPYEKLDLIAVPEYWPGAMEHPGAITFADNILLLDGKRVSPQQRRTLILVIAHELAHMWFGDLVTMAWWDDLWLNESFADWMGYKIAQQLYPQYHLDMDQLQGIQRIMAQDARPASQPIRQHDIAAETALNHVGLDYDKGRAVLGMFEQWVGPDRFRQGVLRYLHDHEWGNATAADLWQALSATATVDVARAMATFLEQPGLPLIRVDVDQVPRGQVRLSQRPFSASGVAAVQKTWQVPVALKYSDGRAVATRTLLLSAPTQLVDLVPGGEVAWVLPQAGATGYYHYALSAERLLGLARLATDGKGALDPVERVAFIGNLSALLDAGGVAGDEYLRVLLPFAADPDPQVLSSLLDALGKVKQSFVGEALRGAFATYVRQVLSPALMRFGLERRPGEDERVAVFRSELIIWLGDEGQDAQVMRFAGMAARRVLADPSSADPATVGAVLRVAALSGGEKLFEEYRRHFESARTPAERSSYLRALGAFRAPALAQRALRYALSGALRPNEIFTISFGMTDLEAGRARVYEWATKNYGTIAARIPPQFVSFMPRIAAGCEEERLLAARKFFAEGSHRVEGTDLELQRVAEQVQECVALRRREGAAVTRSLSGLPAAPSPG